MTSTNGSEETNPTTGVNVTNSGFEPWEEKTNRIIADNLIENIGRLLQGEVKHYYCSDRTTKHEKIVIEFNQTKK